MLQITFRFVATASKRILKNVIVDSTTWDVVIPVAMQHTQIRQICVKIDLQFPAEGEGTTLSKRFLCCSLSYWMINVEMPCKCMAFFYNYFSASGYLIFKGQNLPKSLSFDYYIWRICAHYCHRSNATSCNHMSMLGLDNSEKKVLQSCPYRRQYKHSRRSFFSKQIEGE